MDEILMQRYDRLSDDGEDSDCSDNSREFLPPSLTRVLEEHGYTGQKELGRGSSVTAFLVKNTDGDLYVVKQMNSRDTKELVKVKEKVEKLKSLNHGYIVTYLDSFEDTEAGLFYIVMEYCKGGDLYKRMEAQKERGSFKEKQSDIKEHSCLPANNVTGPAPEISNRYSEDLKELVREMLNCDPHKRPSAEEILAKPFLNDAVKRNKRIPDELQRRFLTSIKTFNEAYKKHYRDFEMVVEEWKATTDELESVHYKATAGSLSGAVIGAAGGITALVGAILAPFTFGASLIVAGVGIGVGVTGGVTSVASNITNAVKQKSLRERFEKIQQDYKTASEPILNSLKTLRRLMRKLTKFSYQKNTAAGETEIVTLGMLASFGRIAVQSAAVGRAIAAASGVLSGILVIADVAFIVKDAREIHEMRRQWRTEDPEKVTSTVLKAIAQMRKSHTELCKVLKEIKETREILKRI